MLIANKNKMFLVIPLKFQSSVSGQSYMGVRYRQYSIFDLQDTGTWIVSIRFTAFLEDESVTDKNSIISKTIYH